MQWDADAQTLRLSGDWVLAVLSDGKGKLGLQKARKLYNKQAMQVQSIDLQGIGRLDHLGAQWLWQHIIQPASKRMGAEWQSLIQGAAENQAMLDRVAAFSQPLQPAPSPPAIVKPLLQLGESAYVFLSHAKGFLRMLGQFFLDLLQFVRNPRLAPWRDISGHLFNMGATALPITAMVGFLIGIVLTYLMALQLQQFGADTFIVNILGISLTRELGPMLAAILIAGRSGSAITAQIGVMRVNEELDAMQVMGIAHGYRLVMPRALALLIAMPLVSLWTTFAALLGGILVSQLVLGISGSFFLQSLPDVVAVSNLYLALIKSAVFGLCIALVGCHFGLRVKPNTQSLGEGTTASVVASITMVILIDAIFAVAFKSVGM